MDYPKDNFLFGLGLPHVYIYIYMYIYIYVYIYMYICMLPKLSLQQEQVFREAVSLL